ncbi:MAG TPA: hypothetical protein PKC29_00845 [Thermodesulfobacteriota bacterium]|nr:hypothetical protein [Thermodesulfobacteriota bacterium]
MPVDLPLADEIVLVQTGVYGQHVPGRDADHEHFSAVFYNFDENRSETGIVGNSKYFVNYIAEHIYPESKKHERYEQKKDIVRDCSCLGAALLIRKNNSEKKG